MDSDKFELARDTILRAKEIVANAQAVIITAGAGMGVDSGLSDFRGNLGFWKVYPPLKDKNLSFTEIANPQWFLAAKSDLRSEIWHPFLARLYQIYRFNDG